MKKIIISYITSIILSLSVIANIVQPINHSDKAYVTINRTMSIQKSVKSSSNRYFALSTIDPDTDSGH